MSAIWRNFSENELQELANNSNSLNELFAKMGYANKNTEVLRKIKAKYPNLILPDGNKNKNLWKNFTEEELQNFLDTTSNLTDFCIKLGYKSKNDYAIAAIKKQYPNLKAPSRIPHNYKDLTGKIFNRLTVIKMDDSKGHGYWLCQCSCGKKELVSVSTYNLKSGNTKSCGCLQRERTVEANTINLIGQSFGKLKVIESSSPIIEKSGTKRTAWKCLCDCGKEVIVKTINLRSGDTQSCGCLNESHGELQIEKILKENKIEYKRQVIFKDLVSKNNYPLRFDFGIYKNNKLLYLIEFNGEQHYTPIKHFGGEEEFKNRVYNDSEKIKYCQKNNIPLYIIRYDENITKEKVIREELL